MKRIRRFYIIILITLICALSYFAYTYYDKNHPLSYNELNRFVDKYYIEGGSSNYKLEVEKDIDDNHVMVYSFVENKSKREKMLFIAFQKDNAGKYKLNKYLSSASLFEQIILQTNMGKGNEKVYAVFYGKITGDYPNKYTVVIDGKQSTEVFERDKVIIREFNYIKEMNMMPIKE